MNYYQILRIPQTATLNEIKRAYKNLVKRYHPDIYEGNKLFAEKRIKEINEAYEVLKEEFSKQEYDAKLHNKIYDAPKENFVKTTTSDDIENYKKIYNENYRKEKKETKIQFIEKLNLYNKCKKCFIKFDSSIKKEKKENCIILILLLLFMFFTISIYKMI